MQEAGFHLRTLFKEVAPVSVLAFQCFQLITKFADRLGNPYKQAI
ncbi:MAG: hypothetical protein V8R91_12140 [Butyricimonas faecihominis]